MRIAFLTVQWPGVRMSGIGAAVRQIALALAAAGHDVHVFTMALPEDADRPPALTIHECDDLAALINRDQLPGASAASIQAGGDGVYRLSLAWRLCQALLDRHREQPFDVVEAPEVEALGLPLVISNDFNAPVITQLHCCTALAEKMNQSPAPADQTRAALEFAAIHLADGLIAPTQAVVGATRRFTSVRDDVAVIPHCIAESSNFKVPPAGPIVFVGRLERLKGVETIAAALNEFLDSCPDATFRFIGPDTSTANACSPAPSTLGEGWGGGPNSANGHQPERARRAPTLTLPPNTGGGKNLRAPRSTASSAIPSGSMRDHLIAILDDDVRGRVEFTGELSPAEVSAAWQSASFGVMPSLWENFSLAACEAMSHGRTLIVADETGSVELVGHAGIIVPQGDAAALAAAMHRLWVDSKLRARLSRSAFNRMARVFNPVKIADQRQAYYVDLIKRFKIEARRDRLQTLPASVAAEMLPALVRMTGSLSGCPSASGQTPGARLLDIMSRIEDEQGQPAKLMLYGAGKHTARLMSERHLWESRRHRVVGIIDDHPRFAQTPIYLDVPVQSMDAAAARVLNGEKLPPVVLSTDTYADQFWRQSAPLRAAGVQVFRLY